MPVSGNYGTPTNPYGDIYSSYWELQWYTGSDPAHVEGDFWGRSDLNSGDKIATLRFDNGNSVVDIPVFPTATGPNSSDIKKVARVPTPNGRGWMPVLQGGGAYNYLAYIHGGNRHGVHDSLRALANTVTNYWPIGEGSGSTSEDKAGNSDLSISGANWKQFDLARDGWMLDFNGSGDAATSSATTSAGNMTIATTVSFPNDKTSTEGVEIFNDGDATFSAGMRGLRYQGSLSTNELWAQIRNDNNDNIVASSTVEPGTSRVALVVDTDAGELRLGVDGSFVATETLSGSFTTTRGSHSIAGNYTTNHYEGNIDDQIVDNAAWDSQDLQEDYESQPWAKARVEDTTDYEHAPAVVEPGDLLLINRSGDGHASTDAGNIVLRRSTDGGATWGARQTIINVAYDDRIDAVFRTSTDRILVFWRAYDSNGDQQNLYYSYSDDEGSTWSAEQSLSGILDETAYGTWGNGVDTSNGLMTCANPLPGGSSQLKVITSTDDGDTWSDHATAVDLSGSSNDVNESCITRVSSNQDELVIYFRETDGTNGNWFGAVKSSDGGDTWTSPAYFNIENNQSGTPLYATYTGNDELFACFGYRNNNTTYNKPLLYTVTNASSVFSDPTSISSEDWDVLTRSQASNNRDWGYPNVTDDANHIAWYDEDTNPNIYHYSM